MTDPEPLSYDSRESRRNGVVVIPPGPWRWTGHRIFWLLAAVLIVGAVVYFLLQIAAAGFPVPDSPYDPPGEL